jgi:hypothetical protein
MVLILNGEVIADTDPRAVAARRGSTGAHSSARSSGSTAPPPPPPAASRGGPARGGTQDPLGGFIEKKVTIPAVFGAPPTEVPAYSLVLVALAAWMVRGSWLASHVSLSS